MAGQQPAHIRVSDIPHAAVRAVMPMIDRN